MWTPCGNWTEWGVPVREEGRACDVSLFESQHHLSQMIRQVIGSTQQDSQSVPGRVFGIVFLSHGAVLQQPLVRGKILQLREQLLVHFVQYCFNCPAEGISATAKSGLSMNTASRSGCSRGLRPRIENILS